MVFKHRCILVLWTKVTYSILIGLQVKILHNAYFLSFNNTITKVALVWYGLSFIIDMLLTIFAENQDVNKLDAPLNSMLEDKKRATTPTPSNWHNCRKLIYVPRSAQKGYSVGHWPIPEAFWPDLNSPTLVSVYIPY